MKMRSWISSQLSYIIVLKSNQLTRRSNFTSLTDFYYICANSNVQNYRSKSFFKLPRLCYQLWTCSSRAFSAILPSTTPLEYQLLLERSHNNYLIRLLFFCYWVLSPVLSFQEVLHITGPRLSQLATQPAMRLPRHHGIDLHHASLLWYSDQSIW